MTKENNVFDVKKMKPLFKPSAHVRKELSKVPREAVCSAVFLTCRAKFWSEIRLARP